MQPSFWLHAIVLPAKANVDDKAAAAAQYAVQSKKETLPYRRWYDSILEPCCQCAHCAPTGAMRGGDQTKIERFERFDSVWNDAFCCA